MSAGGEELFSCSRVQVRTLSISIVRPGVQIPGQVTQTHKGNCSSLTFFPWFPLAFYHVFINCCEVRTGTCYMPMYPVTVLSSREGAHHIASFLKICCQSFPPIIELYIHIYGCWITDWFEGKGLCCCCLKLCLWILFVLLSLEGVKNSDIRWSFCSDTFWAYHQTQAITAFLFLKGPANFTSGNISENDCTVF